MNTPIAAPPVAVGYRIAPTNDGRHIIRVLIIDRLIKNKSQLQRDLRAKIYQFFKLEPIVEEEDGLTSLIIVYKEGAPAHEVRTSAKKLSYVITQGLGCTITLTRYGQNLRQVT